MILGCRRQTRLHFPHRLAAHGMARVFTADTGTAARDKLLAATIPKRKCAQASLAVEASKFISLETVFTRGRGPRPRAATTKPAICGCLVSRGNIRGPVSDMIEKGFQLQARNKVCKCRASASAPVNRSQPACQPASKAPPALRQGFRRPRLNVVKPVLSGFPRLGQTSNKRPLRERHFEEAQPPSNGKATPYRHEPSDKPTPTTPQDTNAATLRSFALMATPLLGHGGCRARRPAPHDPAEKRHGAAKFCALATGSAMPNQIGAIEPGMIPHNTETARPHRWP